VPLDFVPTVAHVVGSPKFWKADVLKQDHYDEVKLLWPLYADQMERAVELAPYAKRFYLQPVDYSEGLGEVIEVSRECANFLLHRYKGRTPWRLSLQTHKLLGLP